ncbi:unnamed protein product [Somion occarium]|uniref:Uncharacterized protein n=1 Tax=Somion occarium TaxID=3059160 RepID=A0ABP1CPJ1_9APHY
MLYHMTARILCVMKWQMRASRFVHSQTRYDNIRCDGRAWGFPPSGQQDGRAKRLREMEQNVTVSVSRHPTDLDFKPTSFIRNYHAVPLLGPGQKDPRHKYDQLFQSSGFDLTLS